MTDEKAAVLAPAILPEQWTSYGNCRLSIATATAPMENPVKVSGSSLADARAALDEARAALAPGDARKLTGLVGELWLRTKKQKINPEDQEATVRLYVRELRAFPGDITADIVRNFRGVFFPALDELRDAIASDSRFIRRRQVMRALEDFVDRGGEPHERPAPRVTPEQAEEIRKRYSWRDSDSDPVGAEPARRMTADQFEAHKARSEAFKARFGERHD